MNPSDLLHLRLANQLISAPAANPRDAVHHLLAMQAQDFAQAVWAVGLRSASSRTEVLAALERGEIVRAAPFRGTLMFVAAEDLGWILSVTSARTLASGAGRFRALGLDETVFNKARDVALSTLSGGRSLDRAGFFAALGLHNIATDGQRGYHIIWWLAQQQVLCWGPPMGTQQALVLVDEWIQHPRVLTRDEAVRELAQRYFTGHGPATLKDFAWWAGITLADARAGIAAAELVALDFEGVHFFTVHTELAPGGATYALPGFDEYVLGYTDRSHALTPETFRRIVPGNNGIFLPIIVDNGVVTGTWRRATSSPSRGAVTTVTPEYFDTPTPETAARFEPHASRYRAFVR